MQVEVGKRYVRRDGRVSGVIGTNSHSVFQFKDEDAWFTYTHAGYVCDVGTQFYADLMAEYIEPVSPSEVSGKEDKVDYDLSGIPEGYTFVGYRIVKEGDQYLPSTGSKSVWCRRPQDTVPLGPRIIVQPIVPPEPKQRTVAIHKWMVADKAGKECIRFGTAEWVRGCKFKIVVDLGLYEEVKVSV